MPADQPTDSEQQRPYHHGNLREALLAAAAESIAEAGPSALSLRNLARRVGVSHAAPAHHFGDKAGLLTAVAAKGYRLLAAELQTAWETTHNFREVGVAYVRFAATHRAHFEVMYRPDLYHADDPDLLAARSAASAVLYGGVGTATDTPAPDEILRAGVAAWSLVHGVATLWLSGNLPLQLGDDPETIARSLTAYLFMNRPAERS